jgi:YggT family protein
MKALRRVIPPLRLGGITLDVSVWVLLIIVWILRIFVDSMAVSS